MCFLINFLIIKLFLINFLFLKKLIENIATFLRFENNQELKDPIKDVTLYKFAVGITNRTGLNIKGNHKDWLDVEQIVFLSFNRKKDKNDIVLFRLKKKLKFSDSVRPGINMTVMIGIPLN